MSKASNKPPYTITEKASDDRRTEMGTGVITKAFENAVEREITEYRRNGFPVARYDIKTRRAYLEFTDGTREYING